MNFYEHAPQQLARNWLVYVKSMKTILVMLFGNGWLLEKNRIDVSTL
jgi:hypothetical protein